MLGMMLFGTLDLNPEKSGNTQVGQTARVWLIRDLGEARLLDWEAMLPSGNRGVI